MGGGHPGSYDEASRAVESGSGERRRSSVWSNKSSSSSASNPKIFDKVKGIFGSPPKGKSPDIKEEQ